MYGSPKFEVGIYNEDVRQALKEGARHRHLGDEWADIHWVTFRAANKEGARNKAEARYPAKAGYVIVDIVELPQDQ